MNYSNHTADEYNYILCISEFKLMMDKLHPNIKKNHIHCTKFVWFSSDTFQK